MKEEKILDQILVFMKNEVSKEGAQLHGISFNFKPSEVIRYIGGASKTTTDGEDLISLKKILKTKHHKLIASALNLAISEEFVKGGTNQKYGHMLLTEKGFARAKSFEANENNAWRRRCDYFLDKILVPLVVSIVTVIITSHLSQKNTEAEIKILKREIEWIKEQK